LEKDVDRLQRDIVEQDATNKDQWSQINHLEKIIEDLVDRVAKTEDKANYAEATTQRATRSNSSLEHPNVVEHALKTLDKKTDTLDQRIAEVEQTVEQLNTVSTQPTNPEMDKLQTHIDSVEK
jgi:uncharacterized coiled-coil protein SlyX